MNDRFMAFPTEAEAKEIAMKRKLAKDEAEKAKSGGAKLEDLLANTGEVINFNIIVKKTVECFLPLI